jgi:hypothetical protein
VQPKIFCSETPLTPLHPIDKFEFLWHHLLRPELTDTRHKRSNQLALQLRQQQQEGSPMSLNSDLADLIEKHRALEKELTEAMSWPGTPDSEIAFIKRKKLRIKDEITRLERDHKMAA